MQYSDCWPESFFRIFSFCLSLASVIPQSRWTFLFARCTDMSILNTATYQTMINVLISRIYNNLVHIVTYPSQFQASIRSFMRLRFFDADLLLKVSCQPFYSGMTIYIEKTTSCIWGFCILISTVHFAHGQRELLSLVLSTLEQHVTCEDMKFTCEDWCQMMQSGSRLVHKSTTKSWPLSLELSWIFEFDRVHGMMNLVQDTAKSKSSSSYKSLKQINMPSVSLILVFIVWA